MLSFSGLGGLRASPLEASGLYDTNLDTLSTQAPRGQKLHGYIKEEWQIKMMACFSSSLMKRVLNFMRNPKLAHILVYVSGDVTLKSKTRWLEVDLAYKLIRLIQNLSTVLIVLINGHRRTTLSQWKTVIIQICMEIKYLFGFQRVKC